MTANLGKLNQFAVTIAFQRGDDNLGEKTQLMVEFVMRYAFYAALIAIFLMVVALIVKLMWNCDDDEASNTRRRPTRPTENTRLLFSKDQDVVVTAYGTNENDLESGNSSSSDDWYDGKICVICYDEPRNCFFIPCGHCVACINCAHRIKRDECKSCPICRGIIDKVRKLHIV